jgi:hypothetical protein
MRARWFLACLLGGCPAGLGAHAGYGAHGWTFGGEGGVGLAYVEANVGADVRDRETSAYVRGDVIPLVDWSPPDQLMPRDNGPFKDARIGAGWSFGDHGGTFLFGGGTSGYLARSSACTSAVVRINDLSLAGTLELQVRYAGGWAVVLAPRVTARAIYCEGT